MLEHRNTREQRQMAFWQDFVSSLARRGRSIEPKNPHPKSWMTFDLGYSGIELGAYHSVRELTCSTEILLSGRKAKERFAILEPYKAKIESELGFELFWYNPNNKMRCRIYRTRKDIDVGDSTQWPNIISWSIDNLYEMKRVFTPYLPMLN